MYILFDVFIVNPTKADNLTYEEEIIIDTIFNFVEERIKILKYEIDQEEEAMFQKRIKGEPNGSIGTMIELKNKRVSFVGYSEKLIEKLKGCFTEKDSLVLSERLGNAFKYLN